MYTKLTRVLSKAKKGTGGLLPISKGGTGASTAAAAAVALGLVTYGTSNKPNRPVVLNSSGKLDPSMYEVGSGSKQHALTGPTSLSPSVPGVYTISDLDDFTDYEISADGAEIQRNNERLTITPYVGVSAVKLRINTKEYSIPVSSSSGSISQPSITSPVNGYAQATDSQQFTVSAFATTIPGETHQSSTWELSSDANFSQILNSVTKSVASKTIWTVSGLVAGRTYFVRVRHHGSSGATSVWSSVIAFSTKTAFVISKLVQTITGLGTTERNQIGTSVAISNDGSVMVLGTLPASSPAYAETAHVFRATNGIWTLETKFTNGIVNSPVDWELFTRPNETRVAISGDGKTIAVAYAKRSTLGVTYGNFEVRVYYYQNSAWSQIATFPAPSGNADSMGAAISLNRDGTVLAIGYPAGSTNNAKTGIAWICRKTNGSFSQYDQALIPVTYADARFGASVELSDDGRYLAVGAPGHITDADQGIVYLYGLSGNSYNAIWDSRSYPTNNKQIRRGGDIKLASDGSYMALAVQPADGVTSFTQPTIGGVQMFSINGNAVQYLTSLQPGNLAHMIGARIAMTGDASQVFIASPLYDRPGSANAGYIMQYYRQSASGGYSLLNEFAEKIGTLYPDGQAGAGMAVSRDGTTLAIGMPLLAKGTSTVNKSTPVLLSIGGATMVSVPNNVTLDATSIEGTLAVPVYSPKNTPQTVSTSYVATGTDGGALWPTTFTFAAGQLNPSASNYGFPGTIDTKFRVTSTTWIDAPIVLRSVNRRVNPAGGYFYDGNYTISGSEAFPLTITYSTIDNVNEVSKITYNRTSIDTSTNDGLKNIVFTSSYQNLTATYQYSVTTTTNTALSTKGSVSVFQ